MTPNLISIFRMISAKLMHTADQHEVICIDPSHYNELRNVIFSTQDELELLRSANETLKNQITAYQLTIANMEAECEGKMLVPIEPTKMMAEAMEYEAAGFDWPEPYWQNILAAASASKGES